MVVSHAITHIMLENFHHQLQQRLRPSSAFGSSLDPFASRVPLHKGPQHVPPTSEEPLWASVVPRLWYQHVSQALREEGFKTCANDSCLLDKDTIMAVLYIDNIGIAYSNKKTSRSFSPTWNPKVSTSLARARSPTPASSISPISPRIRRMAH